MKGQKTLFSKAGPNSKGSDEYGTPPEVFEKLNRTYRFTLDPCADEVTAKCKKPV